LSDNKKKDVRLSYEEALLWIHGLGRFGIKPGLKRVARLLELLQNPQESIRFVHIGGTNGKGSTAAMLASICRAAGYKTGLYTSPYLLSFTNRMAVDGKDVSEDELVDLVARIRPLVSLISADTAYGEMTEFEVVTALALTYFAQKNVDLVILEVGLGGRLDATNIVKPLLSIITNVSLEHTEILGDTVEKIAYEKAGIIKERVPVLTASEDPAALKVIETTAGQKSSVLYRVEGDTKANANLSRSVSYDSRKISEDGQYFQYYGLNMVLDNVFIPLRGLFQLKNASTAVAAAEILADTISGMDEKTIRMGLSQTSWPGRLELLCDKPKLVMDGAHNPAAMKELISSLKAFFSYEKLILIFGALAGKDLSKMLDIALPLADQVIFTRPASERAVDPSEIVEKYASRLNSFKGTLVVETNIAKALEEAFSASGAEDLILVTGSLYTVSDARNCWQNMT